MTIASSLEFDVRLICRTRFLGCISLIKFFLDREDFCFLLQVLIAKFDPAAIFRLSKSHVALVCVHVLVYYILATNTLAA